MFIDLLFKKGGVQQSANGMYVLINESQTQHPANQMTVTLWNLCNGVSFEALLSYLCAQTNQLPNMLQPSLQAELNQMIQAGLIEIRRHELTPQEIMVMQQQQQAMMQQNQQTFQNNMNMRTQIMNESHDTVMRIWGANRTYTCSRCGSPIPSSGMCPMCKTQNWVI